MNLGGARKRISDVDRWIDRQPPAQAKRLHADPPVARRVRQPCNGVNPVRVVVQKLALESLPKQHPPANAQTHHHVLLPRGEMKARRTVRGVKNLLAVIVSHAVTCKAHWKRVNGGGLVRVRRLK